MKVAPVLAALQRRNSSRQTLVHTGQHYDFNMSDVFFQQLGMPAPDINLAVGSGSHGRQTAEIMCALETVLMERKPDLVVVYGVQLNRLAEAFHRLQLLEPLPYLEFLALQRRATVVITDSGGIQEETTYLGVPCLTIRENTERPVTVKMGTNIVVGRNMDRLHSELDSITHGRGKHGQIPPLWDGHAGERIAELLI